MLELQMVSRRESKYIIVSSRFQSQRINGRGLFYALQHCMLKSKHIIHSSKFMKYHYLFKIDLIYQSNSIYNNVKAISDIP
jgi:hypothetical protein